VSVGCSAQSTGQLDKCRDQRSAAGGSPTGIRIERARCLDQRGDLLGRIEEHWPAPLGLEFPVASFQAHRVARDQVALLGDGEDLGRISVRDSKTEAGRDWAPLAPAPRFRLPRALPRKRRRRRNPRGCRGFRRWARRVSNLRPLACEARSRGRRAAAPAGTIVLICRAFLRQVVSGEHSPVSSHFAAISARSGTGAQTVRSPPAREAAVERVRWDLRKRSLSRRGERAGAHSERPRVSPCTQ
jgi:hypothetical protein